jgi:hypothetical protein
VQPVKFLVLRLSNGRRGSCQRLARSALAFRPAST